MFRFVVFFVLFFFLKKDFSPCSLPHPKHTPRIQLQDCVHFFFPFKTHHTNRIKQIKK